MGKIIPLLMAGSGTAVVSVGGFYLVQGSGTGTGTPEGGTASGQSSGSQTHMPQELTLEFEGLNSFTTNPTKSKCVKDYFPTLENKDQVKEINETDKPTDGEFFTTTSGDDSAIKSCLKIEYKKTTYSENKWTGKFTWLWTFTTGTEGFINFNIAETFDEASKLKFTGIFYLVKKKDDEDTWDVKYKKSVSEDKKIEKEELDKYFPKPVSELSSAEQPYWGFLSSSDDLGKICHEASCKVSGNPSVPPTKKELSWTKGSDQSKLLKDWAVDLNWWTNLYKDDNWPLGTKISSFNGKWTLTQ